MEEIPRQKRTNFHLAGIIPVANGDLDFKMPWHDSMMPLAPDYLAFERSVYECAMAGCETILIVCRKETTPLIRHRLGDWILDPTLNYVLLSKYYKNPQEHLKRIPIYYLPIHPKDRDVRDGLTWSIIYGYKKAYHISRMFSRWAVPSKYYVSFPYGTYIPSAVKEYRTTISSNKSVFLSTDDGLTAKDGEYLGFSFDTKEYSGYRKSFLNAENRRWKNGKWENGKFIGEEIPAEERYNGKKISLETFLETADLEMKTKIQVPWYYNISSWQQYCEFLSAAPTHTLRRPKFGFKYNEDNPLGFDDPSLDNAQE